MRSPVAWGNFGQGPCHQAAIPPQRMCATEALGIAVGGIGLIYDTVDQCGRIGRGRKQGCGLEQIAGQTAAHS